MLLLFVQQRISLTRARKVSFVLFTQDYRHTYIQHKTCSNLLSRIVHFFCFCKRSTIYFFIETKKVSKNIFARRSFGVVGVQSVPSHIFVYNKLVLFFIHTYIWSWRVCKLIAFCFLLAHHFLLTNIC